MARIRASTPRPERPHMPGYGLEQARTQPGRRITWARCQKRLVRARSYWLMTVRSDGMPHAAPVWGIWLDRELIFDSGRRSRKTRDLLSDARCIVHLDDAGDALILEGRATRLRDADLFRRFARAYRRKYDYSYDVDDPPGIAFRFRPQVAFAWREELVESATRWRLRPRR